jgi:hypothetical protein
VNKVCGGVKDLEVIRFHTKIDLSKSQLTGCSQKKSKKPLSKVCAIRIIIQVHHNGLCHILDHTV